MCKTCVQLGVVVGGSVCARLRVCMAEKPEAMKGRGKVEQGCKERETRNTQLELCLKKKG